MRPDGQRGRRRGRLDGGAVHPKPLAAAIGTVELHAQHVCNVILKVGKVGGQPQMDRTLIACDGASGNDRHRLIARID